MTIDDRARLSLKFLLGRQDFLAMVDDISLINIRHRFN
jgi:hypothetical protein